MNMSTKAEEYRRKAEEAEAEAERTRDYAAKQIYLEIARRLREIAASAERSVPPLEHPSRRILFP
jgi:hypothetical protein